MPNAGRRVQQNKQPEARALSYVEAVREATDQEMERDPAVIVFGLDVDDPKAIQGTTRGLAEKYGPERVFGTPLSEDAMTGAAIGMALAGLRPIHVHIRMDFLMLAMNQLVNVAAKSRYMFGGQVSVPLVVRSMIGKSWGQGAQHSQGLHSFFMHVPGLKVVAPATPYDAKGCLIAAIRDDNPVLYVEHRLLHFQKGPVPEEPYVVAPGKARVTAAGEDVTLVGISFMQMECLRARALSGGRRHPRRGDRPDLAESARHRHHRGVGGKDRPAAGGRYRLALLRSRRRDRRPGGRAASGSARPFPATARLRARDLSDHAVLWKSCSIPTPGPSPRRRATWSKAPRPAGCPRSVPTFGISNSRGRFDENAICRTGDRPELAAHEEQHHARKISTRSAHSWRQDDPILTQSRNVRAFEDEWSDWLGVKHSVFVNSGSSANLVTLAALKELYGPAAKSSSRRSPGSPTSPPSCTAASSRSSSTSTRARSAWTTSRCWRRSRHERGPSF